MSREDQCWAGPALPQLGSTHVDTQAFSDAQSCSFGAAQRANLVCAGKDDSLERDWNYLTPPQKKQLLNKWEGPLNSSTCLWIPHPKCKLMSAGRHENRFWTASMPGNWSRSASQIYNVWKHQTISSSVQIPATRISSKSATAFWLTDINTPEDVSLFKIFIHGMKMSIYWCVVYWF